MARELTLVTGGNKGIGRGIAIRFARENHDVMIVGRDINALKSAQQEIKNIGVECEYFVGDVSDEKFAHDAVKKIEEKFGKIDHLINNAGLGIFSKIADAKLEDFKKQVDANLYGVFNFTKAVIPGMSKRKNGSIINIASLAGKNSFVGGAMYSATKHAVLGFSRSLMLEVREYNIRVAAICPGSVDTGFFSDKESKPNVDKILKPEDIAETILTVIKMPVRAMVSEIDIRPTNPK